MTKAWKVYGAEGHRQRESFGESVHYDFSDAEHGTRIIDIDREDVTGTNDYVIVRITRDTEEECRDEFWGQVSDGIFENSKVGLIEEVE